MEVGTLGEVVAVVDCPSEAYLPALRSALADVRTMLRPEDSGRVRAVVHLTDASVLRTKGYQAWMAALPPCQHMLCCRQFDPAEDGPSLWSAHRLQVWRCSYHSPLRLPPSPAQLSGSFILTVQP
jgi:hypothetical protein